MISITWYKSDTTAMLKTGTFKTALLILLLVTAPVHYTFSQLYYSENIADSSYFLSLNSELAFNSNRITNSFAGAFYKGEFLDNEIKTNAAERLWADNNLLGYQFNTNLYLNIPGKKNNLNYYIGLEHRSLMELRFNRNFFQLVFFGNNVFTGDFLVLKGLSLTYLNFQQLKAGINKTWMTKKSKHVLTAGIGFNNGQNLLDYELPYGTLFTQQDAEYLNLDLNIKMQRSDTSNSKFGAENGWGFSADLGYAYQDENNLFEFQLEDIGFIRWKKNSQRYDKDTILYFDGIDMSNLLDIKGETISGSGADSILNAFAFSKTANAFNQMIPMRLYLSYKRFFFKKWLSLSLSMNHYFFSLYKPQLRFVPSVNIPVKNSVISIAPLVEVGGYGRFNCGLGISAMINKKFYIEVQTGYLNAYIRPEKSAGVGGYISIIKTL